MPKLDENAAKVDESLNKDGTPVVEDTQEVMESEAFQQFLSSEFGEDKGSKGAANGDDDEEALPPELETQDVEQGGEEAAESDVQGEVEAEPEKEVKPKVETSTKAKAEAEVKKDEKSASDPDLTTVEGAKKYYEEQTAKLREELNRRSTREPETKVDTTPQPQKVVALPFVKNEKELEEVLDSPAKYNKHLTQVYAKVMEDMMGLLPGMINPLVTHYVTVSRAAQTFFTENQDLLPYRDYVGDTVNEVRAEMPEAAFEQVMGEAEKRVRARLQLPRPVAATIQQTTGPAQRASKPNPGFASAKGGSPRTSKPGGQFPTDGAAVLDRILSL